MNALMALLSVAALSVGPGEMAPNFSAKNQEGKVVQLSDFRGKTVLLFFYPKDETSGCTKQACSLRDNYDAFIQRNVVVLGISRQDEKSHTSFRKRHNLPFDLLVDADGKIAESFGVGSMPLVGYFHRESILIDPQGRVLRHYTKVDPATHTEMVLKDLHDLSSKVTQPE